MADKRKKLFYPAGPLTARHTKKQEWLVPESESVWSKSGPPTSEARKLKSDVALPLVNLNDPARKAAKACVEMRRDLNTLVRQRGGRTPAGLILQPDFEKDPQVEQKPPDEYLVARYEKEGSVQSVAVFHDRDPARSEHESKAKVCTLPQYVDEYGGLGIMDKDVYSILAANHKVNFMLKLRTREGFSYAQVKKFKEVFDKFDDNGNAEVEVLELADMLRHLGHIVKLDELQVLISQVQAGRKAVACETAAAYGGHPLAQLSPARRGQVLQDVVQSVLRRCSGTEVARPRPRLNVRGTACGSHQAEYDFTVGGRRVECKSAQLYWCRGSARWQAQFRHIKLHQNQFDDLYLALFTPSDLLILQHDLFTLVHSRGKLDVERGTGIRVGGPKHERSWSVAARHIRERFLNPASNCRLVARLDANGPEITEGLLRVRGSFALQLCHRAFDGTPLQYASPTVRGLRVEALAFEIDKMLNAPARFRRSPSEKTAASCLKGMPAFSCDWLRDDIRVEVKHSRLHFDESRGRWLCCFANIKTASATSGAAQMFDELWLAVFSPRGLHFLKCSGTFGATLAWRSEGARFCVYGPAHEPDVHSALTTILDKMTEGGCCLIVDFNGSGALEFQEFLRLMRIHREDEVNTIYKVYKEFEEESIQAMPKSELSAAMKALGYSDDKFSTVNVQMRVGAEGLSAFSRHQLMSSCWRLASLLLLTAWRGAWAQTETVEISSELCNTSSSTERQEKWEALVAWIHSRGGYVHTNLELTDVHHGGIRMTGLATSAPIPEDTIVMELPPETLLNLKLLSTMPEYSAFAGAMPNCTLTRGLQRSLRQLKAMTLLAVERSKGRESDFVAYFDLLPSRAEQEESDLFFAGESILEDFAMLPVVNFWRRIQKDQYQELESCFHILRGLLDGVEVEWKDVEGLLRIHGSRHFNAKPADVEFLAPAADMVNTGRPEQLNLSPSLLMSSPEAPEATLRLTASRFVAPGEELITSYFDSLDNEDVLFRWNMYLEGNPEILDASDEPCFDEQGTLPSATLSMLEPVMQEFSVPRCKAAAMSSFQGPLRCSLARLAFELCGHPWTSGERPRARGPTGAKGERVAAYSIMHAMILRNRGDRTGATAVLRSLAERAERGLAAELLVDAYLQLAEWLMAEDVEEAEKWAEAAVRLRNKDPMAHFRLGSIQGAKGDQLQALRSFQNSLRLSEPGSPIHEESRRIVAAVQATLGLTSGHGKRPQSAGDQEASATVQTSALLGDL
ncbi:unnamed protein product [Symbiodinium sp. KB8]|nr:unnamed protein product [Symbiodinium sp. KB8]